MIMVTDWSIILLTEIFGLFLVKGIMRTEKPRASFFFNPAKLKATFLVLVVLEVWLFLVYNYKDMSRCRFQQNLHFFILHRMRNCNEQITGGSILSCEF